MSTQNSFTGTCRSCIWEPQQLVEIPCDAFVKRSCALQNLITLAEVMDEPLTSARFNQITLQSVFQPIYSLSHQRVIGFEGLIRGHRNDEPLSPWEIISSADDLEQTVHLDRLCRAIHIRNFQRHIHGNPWLFLNVNPAVAVVGSQFGSFFGKLLSSTGIAPERVVVEILENAILEEEQLAQTVAYYRSMGCLVALDDFGSGHSNFDRIMRIQPDIVKMDTAMIRQAGGNMIARRILPNLVSMLHEAGCMVLFEGIETEDEALLALDANVDFVQGFYFARPGEPGKSYAAAEIFQQLNRQYIEQYVTVRQQRQQALRQYKQQFNQAANLYAAGLELQAACGSLLDLELVQRCYVIDSNGSQLGDTLYPATREVPLNPHYLPLADTRGANWNRKPYFRSAVQHPGKVKVSRPYLSVASAEMCITLSICIEIDETMRVLCCDLQYNDIDGIEPGDD